MTTANNEHDLISSLLLRRGVTTDDDREAFLNPSYEKHTHDPFLMQDMDRAVARILLAIAQKERIAVYADFDCDGIPGASVLSDFFTKVGYENFEVYLPHRDREGYGVHQAAIELLAAGGVSLIVTVDVGTTAIESVHRAKELGVDVIITDHHEILATLPDAYAIINPKLGTYPFRDLCGAGTAFKLVQALLIEGKKRGLEMFTSIPDGWEKWLLDLVAIATVADLVPLIGENRALAYWGLKVLRKSQRPGIDALCRKTRIRKADLDETDIAFSFAPRINAASRMGEPMLALKLLTTRDEHEADDLAEQLEELNASRKGVVGVIVKEAKKRAHDRFREGDRVTVLGDPSWKPALLGLAANSVLEDCGGIVCLWGRDVSGNLKGSCRSDGSISVVELFSSAKDAFQEFGGHAASGGFSVSPEQVHALPEALAKAAKTLVDKVLTAPSEYDEIITVREVSQELHKKITQLAPFGMGNPKPIFRVSRARITFVKRFGKEKNHTEVELICTDTGFRCRSFQFFKSPDDFSFYPVPEAAVSILATLERDTFKGPHALALRIIDIVKE